jgi:hypothetical protein
VRTLPPGALHAVDVADVETGDRHAGTLRELTEP